MKNIAIIIYSIKGGGAERVASSLSQLLSRRHNLYLIIFDSDDIAYPYAGKLIDINIRSHNNIFVKVLNVIRRVIKVRKIKKQFNIHVSISFMGSANIVNVLSKKYDKIITSVRSARNIRGKGIMRFINKILYNKSDKIIGVSKGICSDLIHDFKLDKRKVSVIYNPVNIRQIYKLSKGEDSHNKTPRQRQFIIANMGRLTNAKGQWHLIRALSDVKKEINDVKLLILGTGELDGYLRGLAKRLDLQDNIEFLGYKINPFKHINTADLYVSSSLYEGFPNALVEAMACSIPIISTDCRTGPRELLAPGTDINHETESIEFCEYGILVAVCDGTHYKHNTPLTNQEKLLAKSIVNLYWNEGLRKQYANKGKEAVQRYDTNNVVKEWEKTIEQLSEI